MQWSIKILKLWFNTYDSFEIWTLTLTFSDWIRSKFNLKMVFEVNRWKECNFQPSSQNTLWTCFRLTQRQFSLGIRKASPCPWFCVKSHLYSYLDKADLKPNQRDRDPLNRSLMQRLHEVWTKSCDFIRHPAKSRQLHGIGHKRSSQDIFSHFWVPLELPNSVWPCFKSLAFKMISLNFCCHSWMSAIPTSSDFDDLTMNCFLC